MGNDLLENIRLGNITQCSFRFRYANEEGAYKDEKIDDVWYRNVYKIGQLFDLSAVTYPAYDDTYVNARMQERSKMEDKLKETEEIQTEVRSEEKKEDEKDSEKKSDEKNSDEKEINNEDNTKSEEEKSEEEKEKKDENDSNTDDKKSDNEDKDSDSKKDSEDDSKTDSKDEKRNENKKSYKMNKNIILSEIRSALNSADHKVTLPAETRAVTQTVSGDGVHDEIVETEFKGLLEPLYADSVISNLGITIYNGLPAGDFKVSAMGKGAAAWADETGTATDSKNTFTHVTLQPKRISAQLSYSKQFLAQDTIGAEAAIRRDIYNALVA
jgi:HK97 family phage major capsid protein